MQYYYLQVNEQGDILNATQSSFKEQEGISISNEEYQKSKLYRHFDVVTREFSQPREELIEEPIPEQEPSLEDKLDEQIEYAVDLDFRLSNLEILL